MHKTPLALLFVVAGRALAPATSVAPAAGIGPSFQPPAGAAIEAEGLLPGGFDPAVAFSGRQPFVQTANSVGMEFVLLPAGSFDMGRSDGGDNVWPRHRVTLSRGFWIGRFEVLAAEVAEVRDGSRAGTDGQPAERMAWRDAIRFLNALSRREGLEPCYTDLGDTVGGDPYACEGYRLPTEAEWEYAARSGLSTTEWEGDREPDAWAWFRANCDSQDSAVQPAGLRRANPWGLHDLQGNVREWVHDRWAPASEGRERVDPSGPADGWNRVVRGGRCASAARGVTTTHRFGLDASERTAATGFRVVITAR